MNVKGITKLIEELLERTIETNEHLHENTTAFVHDTRSVLANIYGLTSPELEEFNREITSVEYERPYATSALQRKLRISRGALRSAQTQIRKGTVRQQHVSHKMQNKIKKILEDNNLWVKQIVDGEDTHFLVGKKGEEGRKSHFVIDGKTAEIRVKDNQLFPESLIKKITTILEFPDGRKVRSTRGSMEWETPSPGLAAELPVIEVSPESSVTNFESQEGVNISVTNRTPYPLIIISCTFDGVETRHGSKKLDQTEVFHFDFFNKEHLKDGYAPEFQLEVKTQAGSKYFFKSRLLIKDLGGRFDLQVTGDEEVRPISKQPGSNIVHQPDQSKHIS